MSFKTAIQKVKDMWGKKTVKETPNKDEYILSELITGAEFVHSTVTKSALSTLYIYVTEGANMEMVQEIYAQHGIKLGRHISHLDGKETEVLYIGTKDIMSLTKEQQDFLTRTAPTDKKHKRTVHLSVRPSHVRG